MAEKKQSRKSKTSAAKAETKITRVKAADSKPIKKEVKSDVEKPKVDKPEKTNIFKAIWGYFKGSWYELTQVRWPDRKATWGMTLAVILFTAFFVGLIIVLDYIFKKGFELII